MFIFERQSMRGGGAEREGDTESEAGSRLWAGSTEPDAGLELTNCEILTWDEVGCLTDWATQAPQHQSFRAEEALESLQNRVSTFSSPKLSLQVVF